MGANVSSLLLVVTTLQGCLGWGVQRYISRGGSIVLKAELFSGNPISMRLWDAIWRLPLFQPGQQGQSPTTFGDAAQVMKSNILELYGKMPSADGAPVADAQVQGLLEGSLFLGLRAYHQQYGAVFKLLFGPKSFIVVSDPLIAKFILKDNAKAYDKGVLAEILKPIMGKGLIPADPETWKVRRRAIVPGFHKAWYNAMCRTIAKCNKPLVAKLEAAAQSGEALNMETEFCSVALDIIGKAVFDYDFGSVTRESPVIKAVYSTLKEAEHRSLTPLPYWKLPLANLLVPRLRRFNRDLRLLDTVLNDLIQKALETRQTAEVSELENRDYDSVENASLLRFLVDMRGEDATSLQLRDDLMTMLIAGHETTAAVLTWALFELAQQPDLVRKVQAELDRVLGDRDPTFDDIPQLKLVRLVVAESLRMYPEPPLLIRRALTDHVLPAGYAGFQARIARGTDIFLAVYNIHRSADFWEEPDRFNPERFLRPARYRGSANSTAVADGNETLWAGFEPATSALYPNEVHADFAYLPFGGGPRKCVGDQFAVMEATITLAVLLRRFDFELATPPEAVGMYTGATIHTHNGLMMRVRRRSNAGNQA